MPKHDSPFEYGDYWLDKRRDGRAPDVWQITTRKRGSAPTYRSTGCSDLEQAKTKLVAHVAAEKAKTPANESEALAFVMFKLYWKEHGQNAVSPGQIESSLRVFIGFLISQPDLGPTCTIEQLNSSVFERFRHWRMSEHSYRVIWEGKDYKHTSTGVKGESVQRNLDDVRAALMHAQRTRGIRAPYVPSVPKQLRSPARDRVLSLEELGAIFGYARHNPPFYAWLALLLGTTVRPEAGLAFDPKLQVRGETVDLHPPAWVRTKKVNPVVPLIPELKPLFEAWPASSVNSRKTAWRTMRSALGLGDEVISKTIRHTVATMLLDYEVEPMHIEALLGHRVLKRTSSVYAKWDVRHLEPVRPALSRVWTSVHAAADDWSFDHSLTTGKRGQKKSVVKQQDGRLAQR